MYTIDTIKFTEYGLHIIDFKGQYDLENPKNQFFTIYGAEGYQITKRTGNSLELNGIILADDLTDFKTKTTALADLFSAPGLRSIILDQGALNCFAVSGFTISKVRILSNMYGMFKINLLIV